MSVLFFIVLFLLILLICCFYRRKTIFSLPNIYILMNLIYLLGIIFLTNPNNPNNISLVIVHIVGLTSFLLGVQFVRLVMQTFKISSSNICHSADLKACFIANSSSFERIFAWGLLVFSIFMGLLYYKLVGYNLFMSGLKNFLSEGSLSIEHAAKLRLDAYSGGRYLAPGYFNQFKNIIAVILWQYLFVYYDLVNKRKKIFLLIILPLIISSLLGTGQRSAFAFSVISFLIFWISVHKGKFLKPIILSLIIFFVLFTSTSAIIGRGVTGDFSLFGTFSKGTIQLLERVFLVNPDSAQYGFEYIKEKKVPPQYFSETLMMLRNMLPFNKSRVISIDHLVYTDRYGSSYGGTSPLSTYGNIWYDSRLLGVFFFSVFLGIVYEIMSCRFENTNNLFTASCWSYGKLILGFWMSGGPMSLLYKGIITIFLLLVIRFFINILRNFLMKQHPLANNDPGNFMTS